MEIQITAIKLETVNGKKTGKSLAFKLDPKKMAAYKTETTLRKKIEESVAKSGVFKKEELDDVKYNMKDFLEEWKKQIAIVQIVEDIRRYVHAQWTLGALHGIRHWDRVYENGQKLLTPDTNPLVIGLFAYLHDSCRIDDGEDLYHGKRAADWIETLRGTYLKDVSNEEIELLQEACRLHTTKLKTGNPTIDACFDSDRLDLWRVGVIPDPARLATEKGKEIANSTDYKSLI
jgi:uncharacterized protein